MDTETKLVIIDGNNLFYRAYFTKSRAKDSDASGWSVTKAIDLIASIVRRTRPDFLIVVFDQGKSTYRTKLYPRYKITRYQVNHQQRLLADSQLLLTRRVLDHLRIATWSEPGIEADDIISKIVDDFHDSVTKIIIVSADKDLRQLVTPNTILMDPINEDKVWNVDRVREVHGVDPLDLPELWAICGDKSDDIPGLRYVGEKRAAKILRQYGDLFGLGFSDDRRINGFRHQLYVNHQLFSLHPDLSKFSMPLSMLKFDPIAPHEDGARDVDAFLRENHLQHILKQWRLYSLWTRIGRALRKPKDS